MCHADHFFEHNFYDFLIFLKRMLGFQEKCILALSFDLLQKTEAMLFSCRERYDFFVCIGSETFS